MSKKDVLIDAGLSRAMLEARREGGCRERHTRMLKRDGWSFCPFCGSKLEIVRNCPTCGRDFMSEKSFVRHLKAHYEHCPFCKKQGGARFVPLAIIRYEASRKLTLLQCGICKMEFEKSRNRGLRRLSELPAGPSGLSREHLTETPKGKWYA